MWFSHSTPALGTRTFWRAGLRVVAALFVGAISTENVQATCGDYLDFGGVGHTMGQSNDEYTTEASQKPLGSPCDGPQCRQSPGIPSPPLPIESGPSQDQRAHVQRLNGFNLASPFWSSVAETPARVAPGFPFRVERPPRS
ncbi:MAG TPA: hypothetical protein VMM76_21320 [Pirellulaceae bacterium]|nr:hypothetical protein [Pirellulaceae bacterium]